MFTMPGQAILLRGDEMSVFFTRRGPAPVLGKLLSDYAEGDIVYLNESGSPVEFYVAKHNYESGLNGSGRTLLVRKNCYDTRVWNTSNVNTYATSSIDTWLNNDYKALLDDDIQEIISTTKFYYTPGNGDKTVSTLERSVFLLSITELGQTSSGASVLGSALPISSELLIAYNSSGSYQTYWTRTPSNINTSYVFEITKDGEMGAVSPGNVYASRPIFTMPGAVLFDPDTNEFLKA